MNLTNTHINDLPQLEEFEPEQEYDPSYFFNNIEDEIQQTESIVQLLWDYVKQNPTAISDPDFEENMIEDIKEISYILYGSELFFTLGEDKDIFEDELDEIIDNALALFYIHFMPTRSFPYTFLRPIVNPKQIQTQLTYLKNMPQPAQRTKEWYAFRYNLITASNAYKAFEQSQSVRNQLIYEKCSALKPQEQLSPDLDIKVIQIKNPVNTNSPMHWGQKYEPISVMIYENKYDTKVGDYGCIQHSHYSFLGASPDGINDEIGTSRFGRMLEIKNIVNRDIDGIPKKEYWIQMQLQMETCDLGECDFLETRFKEIDEEEYILLGENN